MESIYRWNGQNGQADDPAQWTFVSGPSDNGTPEAGDTAIVTAGSVQMSPDAVLSGNTVEIGGTNGATMTFAGDSAIDDALPTINATSLIESLVPSQTGAVDTTLDATGMFVNQGTVLANGATGSALTLAISGVTINGSFQPGYAFNEGVIEANAGNTLVISIGSSSAFFNAGSIIADGGTVVIEAASSALAGGFIGARGFYQIADGGTIVTGEFDPASDGNNTTHEEYEFADSTAGNTLKILDVANFGGAIVHFTAGDTIDLGRLLTVGTVVYSTSTGLLSLEAANGATLASLLVGNSGSGFANGTFAVTGGAADGFDFSVAADGDTDITTSNAVIEASGTSGSWQSPASWAGNVMPDSTASPDIGLGASAPFTLTTGDTAVTAAGLGVTGPFATVRVTSDLTLGDGQLSDFGGTVDIAAGNTLTAGALQLYTLGSSFTLAAGATADLAGRLNLDTAPVNGIWPLQPGQNPFAFSVSAGTADIDGALLAGPTESVRGGSVVVGYDSEDPSATMIVNPGATVTATHGLLGSDATSAGTLVIDGATWSDQIDNADTYNSRGYMLVGYNDDDYVLPPGVTPPAPVGGAQLTIENDGTLNDTHAYIANTPGSEGTVTVETGGVWNIGLADGGYLAIAEGGPALLSILAGSTVNVGNTGTFIADGTISTGGGIGVGYVAGANGTISVDGAGAMLNDIAGMALGRGGNGVLNIQNGGQVTIATDGLAIGYASGASATALVSGAGSRLVNTSTH